MSELLSNSFSLSGLPEQRPLFQAVSIEIVGGIHEDTSLDFDGAVKHDTGIEKTAPAVFRQIVYNRSLCSLRQIFIRPTELASVASSQWISKITEWDRTRTSGETEFTACQNKSHDFFRLVPHN